MHFQGDFVKFAFFKANRPNKTDSLECSYANGNTQNLEQETKQR